MKRRLHRHPRLRHFAPLKRARRLATDDLLAEMWLTLRDATGAFNDRHPGTPTGGVLIDEFQDTDPMQFAPSSGETFLEIPSERSADKPRALFFIKAKRRGPFIAQPTSTPTCVRAKLISRHAASDATSALRSCVEAVNQFFSSRADAFLRHDLA